MTSEPAGLRLDAELWVPSALGLIGPHGLLGDVAADGQMSYRPLLTHHLSTGPLIYGLERAVTLVESRDQLQGVLQGPDLAPFCPPGFGLAGDERDWERDHKVAVVVRNRMGEGVNALLVAGLDRFEERVAHLSCCWVPNQAILRTAGADEVLGAGWLTLFRQLAHRGAVGITASEAFSGRDIVDVLRRVAGFRPTADIYGALGLSPADHVVVLAEWRATVEDGQVVRFATRPDLDAGAHADLVQRLAAYLEVANPRPVPDSAERHERLSLGGEVGIDGIQGWGNVCDDDWYRPPPDEAPAGSDRGDADIRATAALVAWLRAQGGTTSQPD
jgi:hypothetical protein